MNIFDMNFMKKETAPEVILEAIDKNGSYDDLCRRMWSMLNREEDVSSLEKLVKVCKLDLDGVNVAIIKKEEVGNLFDEYQIPNMFNMITAAATTDVVSGVPYIIITDEVIRDGHEYVSYFDAIMYHELIHIDQYRDGRLKSDHTAGIMVWEGVEYSLQEMAVSQAEKVELVREKHPELDYTLAHILTELDKPWELEAYASMFLRADKLSNLPAALRLPLETFLEL